MTVAPAALPIPETWVAPLADAVLARIEERERWVTVDGLAEYLRCSKSHVYDLREKGLPARTLPGEDARRGKRLYFSLREVSEWFEREGIAA
jgi:Helix-turn-helix domain